MDSKKLHLGCGKKYLQGYIHVDLDNKPHIDYPNTDISKLDMFKNDEVDEIYNCGTFEYFDLQKAPKVLEEWFRVLKPGGILRISVPNFESVIQVYLNNGKDILGEGILGLIYGRWPIKDKDNNDFEFEMGQLRFAKEIADKMGKKEKVKKEDKDNNVSLMARPNTEESE